MRQEELAFNTEKLELEQLNQQCENEKKVRQADQKVKELEDKIFTKSMSEVKRTLDDAQIKSPRKAIVTYINNQIGAQVPQWTKVAVISDLSYFKVECEISDGYANRVISGSGHPWKGGAGKFPEKVGMFSRLSKNGGISFMVKLETAEINSRVSG